MDKPGHVIDLLATCIDLAGADYPETREKEKIVPLEGKSLGPNVETRWRQGHEAIF